MYEQMTTCKKCQSARSTDLKSPCKTCGAHATLFGYLFDDEFKTAMWATIIVSGFIIFACLSGMIFLAAQSFLLTK